MTQFTAVWLWTLLRSGLLIILALPCCGVLVRWIGASRGWRHVLQWSLLSVPFLFPELLTGYAYGQMTRLLITGPWIREVWFDLLLFLRVVPVGTLLWYCSPPSPLSREAIHARALAFRDSDSLYRRFLVLTWYHLQGPARTGLFASCGLFLVLFQEFELASLLAVKSWTVWLFDAQAEGLMLSESLRHVALPASVTWIVCCSLLWSFVGPQRTSAHPTSHPKKSPTWIQGCLWIYLILGCLLIGVYPLMLIGLEGGQGLMVLVRDDVQSQGLAHGILTAGGTALIASMLTDVIANGLVRAPATGWSRAAFWAVSVGFSGPLAIGLTLVALFQLPGFIAWRETPEPVVLGLVLWLLPRAVILQGIRQTLRSPSAAYSAALLAVASDSKRRQAARCLHWLIEGRIRFASRVLLFHWAYWDLTLPHLLNPTGLVSAPVRLYGDAHFSRNAVLTAKAGLTMLAPVLMLIVIWGLWRLIQWICDCWNAQTDGS